MFANVLLSELRDLILIKLGMKVLGKLGKGRQSLKLMPFLKSGGARLGAQIAGTAFGYKPHWQKLQDQILGGDSKF